MAQACLGRVTHRSGPDGCRRVRPARVRRRSAGAGRRAVVDAVSETAARVRSRRGGSNRAIGDVCCRGPLVRSGRPGSSRHGWVAGRSGLSGEDGGGLIASKRGGDRPPAKSPPGRRLGAAGRVGQGRVRQRGAAYRTLFELIQGANLGPRRCARARPAGRHVHVTGVRERRVESDTPARPVGTRSGLPLRRRSLKSSG
jgi:hypothetical protein